MESLTKRQEEVLRIIDEFTANGLPPTYAELRQRLRVESNQTVKDFINILSEKGYLIQKARKARAIKLSEKANRVLSRKLDYGPEYGFVPTPVLNVSILNEGNSSNFSGQGHSNNE